MLRGVVVAILIGSNCFGQTAIKGDWLTTGTASSNYRLVCFKSDSVTNELQNPWRTYSLRGENLIIHCMDWTEKQNKYTSTYAIKSLSKDSIMLVPTNEIAVEETKRLYSWPQQLGFVKLFRRELISRVIEFDSVSYTSNQLSSHLISYYSPASHLRVVLKSNGAFTYRYHTIDTSQAKAGRRRIVWPGDNRDSINNVGHLAAAQLASFRNLLNVSNIQNIDMMRDFRSYTRWLHGEPTTLEVFKDGQALYTQTSKEFPRTIVAVIDFLCELRDNH